MENDKQVKQESPKKCDRIETVRAIIATLIDHNATVNDVEPILTLARMEVGATLVAPVCH